MTASLPRYSREETALRGQEIYERDLRPFVEAAHQGEFAAIELKPEPTHWTKTTTPRRKISWRVNQMLKSG